MIQWIKSLGISLKGYLYGLIFLVFSGLLVALKLKDSELHGYQVKDMEDRFKAEQAEANKKVEEEKRKYEDS